MEFIAFIFQGNRYDYRDGDLLDFSLKNRITLQFSFLLEGLKLLSKHDDIFLK